VKEKPSSVGVAVVLLQDGSNRDRHGGLSLRGGASSVGWIALLPA